MSDGLSCAVQNQGKQSRPPWSLGFKWKLMFPGVRIPSGRLDSGARFLRVCVQWPRPRAQILLLELFSAHSLEDSGLDRIKKTVSLRLHAMSDCSLADTVLSILSQDASSGLAISKT